MLQLKVISKKGKLGSPWVTKHETQEDLDAYVLEQRKKINTPWGKASHQKTFATMDLGLQAGGTFLAQVPTEKGIVFNFQFEDEFILEITDITQQEQIKVFKSIGDNAANFGKQIVSDFRAENISMGITQKGMTREVLLKSQMLVYFLESGSLYEAITELNNFSDFDPEFLTPERINIILNKINNYLT